MSDAYGPASGTSHLQPVVSQCEWPGQQIDVDVGQQPPRQSPTTVTVIPSGVGHVVGGQAQPCSPQV